MSASIPRMQAASPAPRARVLIVDDNVELVGSLHAVLMTAELMDTLVDHSAGNYRLLMIMGAELLAYGMAHDVAQLDEKCYLEVFQPRHSRPALKKKVKV